MKAAKAARPPMRWVGEMGAHEPLRRYHECVTCIVCGHLIATIDIEVEPARNAPFAHRAKDSVMDVFRGLHACEEEVPLSEVEAHPLPLSKDQGTTEEDQREPPDPEDDMKPCPDCGVPVAPGEQYAPYCSKDHLEDHP